MRRPFLVSTHVAPTAYFYFSWVTALLLAAGSAQAQFPVVIDIPPQPDIGDHGVMGSGTQLNLNAAGKIGLSFDVGAPNIMNTNLELNVKGGTVGNELQANPGSVTNISAGVVGNQLSAFTGSTVNISGGRVGSGLSALTGSEVNIFGGMVGNNLSAIGSEVNIPGGTVGSDVFIGTEAVVNVLGGVVGPFLDAGLADRSSTNVIFNVLAGIVGGGSDIYSGTIMTMHGGLLGLIPGSGGDGIDFYFGSYAKIDGGTFDYDVDTFAGSDVHICGCDFELDGEPLIVGSELQFDIPVGSILTGVLTDGTPFALGTPLDDEIGNDTLTLHCTALPAVGPATVNVPPSTAVKSIRGNQTLTVGPGGVIDDFFRTGSGSTLVVAGGTVGREAQVVGTNITISSGRVGEDLTAIQGSTINMTGGELGGFMDLGNDSVMNVSGGSVGIGFRALAGSQLNVTGGTIGSFFSADSGSEMNLSGGTTDSISVSGKLNIYGGEFRLDGVPVTGLDTVGSSVAINIPTGGVLSGTLADGTPFAFSQENTDYIAHGNLRLHAAAVPAVGPASINVPADPAPRGIRQGQTLTLSDGGQLAAGFAAAAGSTLNITGGSAGGNLEAVGATVNISGGNAGSNISALAGSRINVSGGSANRLLAYKGSEVNISGGSVCCMEVKSGSKLNISGGMVIGTHAATARPIVAQGGSEVNISGGTIEGGNIFVGDAALNISGGTFNTAIYASSASRVNLVGTQFLLNGQPIPGMMLNEPFLITSRDMALSGVLADGLPFSFDLKGTFIFGMDWFDPAAMLTATLVESVPLMGDYNSNGVVDAADHVVWRNTRGQTGTNLAADGNGDGRIDQADYNIWRAQFGRTSASSAAPAASNPTPEPATIWLLCWAGLASLIAPQRARAG
jgi:hypothetical protein